MGLFDETNIDERLNCLIKIGEVSSVDYAKGTARVVFDDDDSVVSNDLQVLHTNTLKNKDFAMPDIGEDVVCLFLPSGTEEGFILGSVYAGEITPPENSGDKRTIVFSDGTKVCYNRAIHELSVEIEGTTIVADRADVKVTTPANVEVNGATMVKVDTQGTVVVTAASSATITAPTIALNGNVTVSGTVTAAGDVVGAGISLQTHVHTGNAGAPTSPPIA